MGRPSRESELRRYRAFIREELAEAVRRFEPTMHPDFGLTDQDAADLQSELEDELRTEQPPLLLVTATTRPGARGPDEEAEEPGYCLGLRFCYPDGVAHVERLLIQQVRKRYSVYTGMTAREVRQSLHFTVWAVPNPPKRGGWPRWLGPTGYYV